MADKRRVRLVITGYYEIDMDTANEVYGTSNIEEIVATDRNIAQNGGVYDALEWLDEDPTVTIELVN